MIDIKIVAIGKIKDKNILAIFSEYAKRLGPYAKFEQIELPMFKFSDTKNTERAKKDDSKRVLDHLEKMSGYNSFLLSETGKELSSVEFARKLDSSSPKIAFAIAGAFGWDDEIKKHISQISLSKLTFPHELARLVLIEQIYRGLMILNNKKYHY